MAPLLGLGIAAVTPVTNALIADLASARRLGVAMSVFGTIWHIGEAAGPIVAGFLIVGLGYTSTFDILALVTVAVSIHWWCWCGTRREVHVHNGKTSLLKLEVPQVLLLAVRRQRRQIGLSPRRSWCKISTNPCSSRECRLRAH
jgi:MFS family permease